MREIKFRGRRLDGGGWTYGYLVPVTSDEKTQFHIVSEIRGGSVQGFAVDPATIGQLTGIKDKNGLPVYEGDIVRYRTTDERYTKNPKYVNALINYRDGSARFQANDIYYDDLWSPRLQVIGNIHDNPELLDHRG